jgi:hypothetical protein
MMRGMRGIAVLRRAGIEMPARATRIRGTAITVLVDVETVRAWCKPFDAGADAQILRYLFKIHRASDVVARGRRQSGLSAQRTGGGDQRRTQDAAHYR